MKTKAASCLLINQRHPYVFFFFLYLQPRGPQSENLQVAYAYREVSASFWWLCVSFWWLCVKRLSQKTLGTS